jgi:acyl-CoA thioesterase-1
MGDMRAVSLKLAASCLVSLVGVYAPGAAAIELPNNVQRCLSLAAGLDLGAPPARTRAKLRTGKPVTIVALGSSSTSGFGTFGPGYPEALQAELSSRHPALRINVVNSGRMADTLGGMLARLDSDVLRYKPDLVVWQFGTNDVVWHGIASDETERLRQGIARLKKAGADVILMDLQYAPWVLMNPSHEKMENLITGVARVEKVGLFPRFSLMHRALAQGVGGLVFLDGLHNSGAGYQCIGRALARMIDE